MCRSDLEKRGQCLSAMIDCIDDMYSTKKDLDEKTRKQYFSMRYELKKVEIKLINMDYPEIYEQLIMTEFK